MPLTFSLSTLSSMMWAVLVALTLSVTLADTASAQLASGGSQGGSGPGAAPDGIQGRWIGSLYCGSDSGWAVTFEVTEGARDDEATMTWYGGRATGTDPYDVFTLSSDRFLFDSRTDRIGRDFDLTLADGLLFGPQRNADCRVYLLRDPLAAAAE